MKRRPPALLGIVLAAGYLLISTGTAFSALEGLIPAVKTIEEPNFPCAEHACGCRTAEQCSDRCCCVPTGSGFETPDRAAQTGPVTVKISFLSAAQCAGADPDAVEAGAPKWSPHVPAARFSFEVLRSASERRIFHRFTLLRSYANPPDKVPIHIV